MKKILFVLVCLLVSVSVCGAAPYLGDFVEDGVVHFMWHSNTIEGASVTRATDGTISVYKSTSTTAYDLTQSVAGVTDVEDGDGFTGIHHCIINLGADAFYAVSKNYTVVVTAATIDGETVNAVLAHFSIENRFKEVTVTSMAADTVDASALKADAVTEIIDNFETQSQADPTGFHVNILEVGGTAQTANDNGADINEILTDTGTGGVVLAADAITAAKIADNAFSEEHIDTAFGDEVADQVWDEDVESTYSSSDLLRLLGAFVAGKTSITENSAEDWDLTYRDIPDSKDMFIQLNVGSKGDREEASTLDLTD